MARSERIVGTIEGNTVTVDGMGYWLDYLAPDAYAEETLKLRKRPLKSLPVTDRDRRLSALAAEHGTTVEAIKALNDSADPLDSARLTLMIARTWGTGWL